MTDPTATAERLAPYAQSTRKPVLASWMGGPAVAAGDSILNGAGIPTFDYPDAAARAFTNMWKYTYNLRSIYETPEPAEDEGADRERAEEIIGRVRDSGRTILTEFEAKEILAAYGIPTVETQVARSPDEAVEFADRIGYPVVLKLDSETITHKTDVGGVRLNLQNSGEVRRAYEEMESSITENYGPEDFGGAAVQEMVSLDGYELIVGSSLDPQFGPVLLFGSGGSLVEVYRDRALALPPLTTTLARRMMERTRIFEALGGVRGKAPGRRRLAGEAARAREPARRGTTLDQGARHQPAPRLARAPDGPRRPHSFARPRDAAKRTCRARRSAPTPRSTSPTKSCATARR